jgi:cytochrome c-type biogenesis protein CcmH/NrfG
LIYSTLQLSIVNFQLITYIMKHLFLSILASWTIAFSFASNSAYEQAMQQALSQLAQADSPEAFQAVANQFQRIAQVEKDQWLPFYYTSYAYIIHAAMSENGEQKDQGLDQAQQYLDEAQQLAPEESEVVALQGYLHTIRVAIDPANRGPELAPQATQILSQAVQMNPDNPRAMLLLAQMQYGTAQFFNSDMSEVCALASQAIAKFEQAEPESPLHPTWGKWIVGYLQRACDQ